MAFHFNYRCLSMRPKVAKPKVDLTKVSPNELLPEGRFRARIGSIREYPEGEEVQIGDAGELIGQTWDDGRQKYAWIRVGYRFTEHPSNVAADPRTGEARNLAGRMIFANYDYGDGLARMRGLFDAAGVSADAEFSALEQREVDVTIRNRGSRDDPELKKSIVQSVRVAVG